MRIFDATPHAACCEENVQSMKTKLCDSQVLAAAQENRGLLALDGTVATPQQHKDLIAFRDICKKYHEAHIKYYVHSERPKCTGTTPPKTPPDLLCSKEISKEDQSERARAEAHNQVHQVAASVSA